MPPNLLNQFYNLPLQTDIHDRNQLPLQHSQLADRDGIPYAIETLTSRKLLVLHHEPIPAIAR